MIKINPPPNLEPRFQRPENWQWGFLDRGEYTLRYGYAAAPQGTSKGIIIICPGLSEFSEKYFETAREALARSYDVIIIDWRGQGASTRYLDNPHKRHSHGFDNDVKDLKAILKHCPLTKDIQNRPPLFILAHSMGAHIALKLMIKYPCLIEKACLSAPMIGLYVLDRIPACIASPLIALLAKAAPKSYAPTGGNWKSVERDKTDHSFLSHDPVRNKIHNAWMKENPTLQVGHITNQWLSDAKQSCAQLQNDIKAAAIKTPCLIASGGQEKIISNIAILNALPNINQHEHLHLPEAGHEIFMEKDESRAQLIEKFYYFINNNDEYSKGN